MSKSALPTLPAPLPQKQLDEIWERAVTMETYLLNEAGSFLYAPGQKKVKLVEDISKLLIIAEAYEELSYQLDLKYHHYKTSSYSLDVKSLDLGTEPPAPLLAPPSPTSYEQEYEASVVQILQFDDLEVLNPYSTWVVALLNGNGPLAYLSKLTYAHAEVASDPSQAMWFKSMENATMMKNLAKQQHSYPGDGTWGVLPVSPLASKPTKP